MTRQVRAELAKVFSTRMVWGLLAGYLGFVAVNVVVLVLTAGREGVPPLDTTAGLRGVYASASTGTVFALVLGVLAVTTEFRHGTATSTFLAVPRRGRVIAGKLLALPAVTFGYGILGVALTVGLAYPLVSWRGADASLTSPGVPQVLLGSLVGVTLYSLLGVGFGALIRNQVAAIVSALLWMLLVESSLVTFLPEVGRWTPGGAASAMTLTEPMRGVDLLPPWAGALLFVAYGVVLAVVGTRSTLQRDVT